MANIDTLTDKLSAIGDAIREKIGEEDKLSLDDMPTAIESISGGGGSEGLNDDFRTYVENYSEAQLSFNTYQSNGTSIAKSLVGFGITDIDMPNLKNLRNSIPINNTIAPKLETYPLTDMNGPYLVGSCDKLELLQPITVSFQWCTSLSCPILAGPYMKITACSDGDLQRDVYWAPEKVNYFGYYDSSIRKTNVLILTREDKIVTLNTQPSSTSYFNSNTDVYVPASLLDSYKTATNWSVIADQIYAIEDSEIILKGIFTELDNRYNWSGGELSLIERLQRQKRLNTWSITYNELLTIANDLADNGENSEYYNYKDCLVINSGLPITENINLFITDTFKYKDVNGDLIPLSGLLSERQQFLGQQGSSLYDTGLKSLWGTQRINQTSTNTGGFGESQLYHKLNDSDGDLFTLLPTSLTNNLVEWQIDNNHTALLAPPSETEIFGTTKFADTNYEIYEQLALFTLGIDLRGSDAWWERSPLGSDSAGFCIVNSNGDASAYNASIARGLAPAIALGKKGVNNG